MANADFTIADVLAWARTKPADGRYNYTSPNSCALCHFLRDTGRAAQPFVRPWTVDENYGWRDGVGRDLTTYPQQLEDALAGDRPYVETFGGLASRLEKLCPETPVRASNWAAIDTYLEHIDPELVQ